MQILVDITHPAHVHFFRGAIALWRERGHDVVVAVRDKDIACELLGRFGLDYTNLGKARSGLAGLVIELVRRNARLFHLVGKLRPDVMTGIGGVFIAQVGWLRRIPSVVFTDTENATLSNRITFPFATVVSTPECFGAPVPSRKHHTYKGYHELAYTHPRRFRPDSSVLSEFGLSQNEPFIVMRQVSWGALHDVGDHGFTDLREAIADLRQHGRVLISSEEDLPADLAAHQITASPEKIHQLLFYARLFIGESATMASEGATLGTPAILISTSRRGYTDEQESKYGLTFTYDNPKTAQAEGLERALEILANRASKQVWKEKRKRMLADMIDVTLHIVELVESYGRPRSARPVSAGWPRGDAI